MVCYSASEQETHVEALDKSSMMALMLAPQEGQLFVLQYMLHDAGANVEIMRGQTCAPGRTS
eukprot:1777487-Karenia_brevis.AAC.1